MNYRTRKYLNWMPFGGIALLVSIQISAASQEEAAAKGPQTAGPRTTLQKLQTRLGKTL